MKSIDLNCDMGEAYGRYDLGTDEEIIRHITSANIACGWHAGDPLVMDRTVKLAKENSVNAGAHPGFPDLLGFGRRNMACTPREIRQYVIYQIGRCYFEQLDTIDRDQSVAQMALESFERLVKGFAQTAYADKAREHIKQCQKSLAGHEFYVGMFYYKSRHYRAALQRFKTVVSRYPDVGIHHEALHYIARCEASLSGQETEKQAD